MSLPFESFYAPLFLSIICFVFFLISGIPFGFVVKRFLLVSPFFLFLIIMNPSHPFILFLKVFTSFFYLLLFLMTTPFISIMRGMEKIGIPHLFVLLVSFGYRYFFLLTDEMERALRAWRMRGARGRRGVLEAASGILYSSFLRSMKRAERIGFVMKMRGFHGEDN